MATVELHSVQKRYGEQVIIPPLDLKIESGEFMVLVGPSGCGKSTLLRMISGLESTTEGNILINGKSVEKLSAKDRGVAMVFQNYALYPHMNVEQNITFALRIAKVEKSEIQKRLKEVSEILSITELLQKKPGQLSGGQKQRVAIGRAMIRNPSVFLFDEPLSNLDAQLRVKMRTEISLLHQKLKCTIIYVTHDQVEAMTLADRITVLNKGNIEQIGSPKEIYQKPKSKFVASFIGTPPMNFISADKFSGRKPSQCKWVGFRSEDTYFADLESLNLEPLGKAKVILVEPLGSSAYVHFKVGEEIFVSETKAEKSPCLQDEFLMKVDPNKLFYFGEMGNKLSL